MRTRYFGLVIAGAMLEAWIAASPVAAAPKAPIGTASRVNLTLAQQDLASAWYRELGKIEREGKDAARRGDDHALGSAIQKAGIVVLSAKHGEAALGTLPISIREQIAAAGRRVAKTLSARRRVAGRASRSAERRARQVVTTSKSSEYAPFTRAERDENGELIYTFISSVLDRDLDARHRRSRHATGIVVNDRDTDLGSQPIGRPKSTSRSRASKPRSKSSGGAILDDDLTLFFGGLPLFSALFSWPPAETEEKQLHEAAAYYSEAQGAYSRGPSASGDAKAQFEFARNGLKTLAESARSPKVRKRARKYLSRLPKHFVEGHSRKREASKESGVDRPRTAAHRRANEQVNQYPNINVNLSGGGE